MPLLGALAAAALAGAATGLVIGAFCVRLHGTYFALLTLAFSQFLYAIALKWRDVTRGDEGGRPDPSRHRGKEGAYLGGWRLRADALARSRYHRHPAPKSAVHVPSGGPTVYEALVTAPGLRTMHY